MGDNASEMAQLTGINLGTGRTATAISTGLIHTCALLDNASVKCWGFGSKGILGIDNATSMGRDSGEMALIPVVKLGTGRTATAISAGNYYNCVLRDNASVICFGDNQFGQSGIDNTTEMGKTSGSMALLTGVNLGTGRTATAITTGYRHTCVILDNASVKCWGLNSSGELGIDNNTTAMGDGSGEMALIPVVNLGTGRTATAIDAGQNHTCVILDNASVKCWGQNTYGQLGIDNATTMGDGSGEMALIPVVNLGTGRTATAISAGNAHTCVILDNASAKCWGRNQYGQLGIDNATDMGDNSSEMAQLTSINLGTGRTATAISAGYYHTCARLDNTSVKCWGYNINGQLGIDNNTDMGDDAGEMDLLIGIDL
jgi:alpha-tubulin suppressor-like RCC1 family protein